MPRPTSVRVGDRYGRLEVVRDLGTVWTGRVKSARWLECLCDCGNTHKVFGHHLRAGKSKSCGCLFRERLPTGEAAFRSVVRIYKYNARTRKLVFDLDDAALRELFHGLCHYCGALPSQVGTEVRAGIKVGAFTYNGVDRIDNSKGYVTSNVVPCCYKCNRAKMDLTLPEFVEWVGRVYDHVHQAGHRIAPEAAAPRLRA